MTAILGSDVFPQLEKDPLLTQDEDIIPPKYGTRWFEA